MITVSIERWHPVLVHLPIGIYFLYILGYALRSKQTQSSSLLLLVGALGSTAASITGYLLSFTKGYDYTTLIQHLWAGIGLTVAGWMVWLLERYHRSRTNLWIQPLSVILLALGILLTGHLGGSLTHGDGFLFKSNKPLTGSATKIHLDSISYYQDVIKPILTEYCISCHRTERPFGLWDITTDSTLFKGGRYGHTIVAGDPDHSELIKRLEAALDSKKHMPPATMPQPKAIEIFLIREWIKRGAAMDTRFREEADDSKLSHILSAYLGISQQTTNEIRLPIVKPVDSATLRALTREIGILHKIHEESNLLDISLIHFRSKPRQEVLSICNKLKPVSENIYQLDLSGLGLSSDDLAFLRDMKNLVKINLANNRLEDRALNHLLPLTALESINLYNNPVTDASIKTLFKLPLRTLTLGNTKIREEAIQEIMKEQKGVQINY